MIDPKLNELPVERSSSNKPVSSSDTTGTRSGKREGLSINDTIAGDTLLSSGSRGVETSGVRAGAGVGGGSSSLTASAGASPAPTLTPGARTTGTTAAGSNPSGLGGRADTGLPGTGEDELSREGETEHNLSYDDVSARAYQCWCERGCPTDNSGHLDWVRAEQQLRDERLRNRRTSAASV